MVAMTPGVRRLSCGAALLAALAALGLWVRPPDSGREFGAQQVRYDRFRDRVVPVLDRRCSSCHGVPDDRIRLLRDSQEGRTFLRWALDASGRLVGEDRIRDAHDRLTTPQGPPEGSSAPIDRGSPALASPLLRSPLAPPYSGMEQHPEVFAHPGDPDFVALREWVEAEIGARPAPSAPLTDTEGFFAERVSPILVRKTCFGANCHGMRAFNDLKLDPGIPALANRFTDSQHRANRRAMLGEVTRLVSLSGDVESSRQLVKNIPLDQGGIVHKGGNRFFDKGDPDYEVLREWLEREKADARRRTGAALGEDLGLLFVRRSRSAPERFYEDLGFVPDAELLLAKDGRERRLCGPADIRSPDVAHDGRRAVFAMRRSADQPFDLWEVDLESGDLRQLTYSTDPKVHFLDPLYVPDPDDPGGDDLGRLCLVFVSNLAGGTCAASPDGLLGEAEGGDHRTLVDAARTERSGTFTGRRLRVVRGTNHGEERRIIAHDPGRLTVDPPFPAPVDGTTHYVIEATSRRAPRFDGWRIRLAARGEEAETFRTTLRRLTWSPEGVRRPTLRSSGEIVFTALRTGWQGGRPFFNGALFRTHEDGSNFHPHHGNRSGIPVLCDDRELPNGLEVRIGRDADSYWGGMAILSDHQFGPTIEPDNPVDDLDQPFRHGPPETAQHRFVPGWVALDPTAACRGVSPGGAWRDPWPLPDGSILIAHAPGPVDLADPAAAPDFDILRLVPDPSLHAEEGFAAGRLRREIVAGGPKAELWPRAVIPRLKEPVHKTLKAEDRLFGPPGRVSGFTGYPAGTPAVLRVFDLLVIDTFFEQNTPIGVRHLAAPVCPSCGDVTAEIDEVRWARILGQPLDGANPGRESGTALIAEVPVESDGSIFVALPSGVAFDIQSLNRERMALRWSHRWLYAVPGENHTLSIPRALYAQTCAGCHGGVTGRPTDVLRRPDAVTSASRTAATWDSTRMRARTPSNLDSSGAVTMREYTFERDVRPILARSCVSCHSGAEPGAALDLSGPGAHASLMRFVDAPDSRAVSSPLMEKLLGRELKAPAPLRGDAPHPSAAPLGPEDIVILIRWIDLGARRGGDGG